MIATKRDCMKCSQTQHRNCTVQTKILVVLFLVHNALNRKKVKNHSKKCSAFFVAFFRPRHGSFRR